MVTGEKPPDKSPPVKSKVSLGYRPGTFHGGANVRGAFHPEPRNLSLCKKCYGERTYLSSFLHDLNTSITYSMEYQNLFQIKIHTRIHPGLPDSTRAAGFPIRHFDM